MEHQINWFEIPAADFNRAAKFYGTVLGTEIHGMEMMGDTMGFLPSDGRNVSGAIVAGEAQTPGATGVVIYLNGGDDLAPMLARVEEAGGTIIVPKTEISPEFGWFAQFIDTEGNRMGLHSRG